MWFSRKPAEGEELARNRMIALALCAVMLFGCCLWDAFGWRLRYELVGRLPDKEGLRFFTYLDRKEDFTFTVTEGKEPLFTLEFGEDSVWAPMVAVYRSDWGQRYWFIHAGVLRDALSGFDYELTLDEAAGTLVSLVVTLPDDNNATRDRVREALKAVIPESNRFTTGHYSSSAPDAVLLHVNGYEEHLRLVERA